MKVKQLFEAVITPDRAKVYATLEKAVNSPQMDLAEEDVIDIIWVLNQAFKKQKIEFLPGVGEGNPYRKVQNPLWVKGGLTSGVYNPADDAIVIYVSPQRLPAIIKDPLGKRDFIEAAASMIGHEFVHREQAKRALDAAKIKGKSSISPFRDEEQDFAQYVADPHEIMAMAHEIVYELEHKGYNPAQIFAALKQGKKNVLRQSSRYKDYEQYAADNRLVMNRLYKNLAEILTR